MIHSEKMRQIPKWNQRQDSTHDQLKDLISIANRLGFYDAADFLRTITEETEKRMTK